VSVQDAFGADLASLEKGWHARLDAVHLRPGLLALLTQRAAVTAAEKNPAEAELTAAVLGPAGEWHPVAPAEMHAGDPGAVRKVGGEAAIELTGEKNEGDWCEARFGKALGDAMVRCTAAPLAGCYGVKIQIGPKCQALVLRGQGTFLYTEVGGVGHDGTVQLGSKPVQIVLRRRGSRGSVWVDDRLLAEGPVDAEAGLLGVGSVGGAARFTDISVRKL
jgi:hypothetical protein